MGNKYVIVLTACINPGKMIHTSLTDVDIRRRQYEDALEIDDSKGCNFEHILFTSIDEQKDFVFYPFLIRPLWRGISGTNGREYWEGNYTSLKLAYFKRMLNCMTEYNMCHPHNKPSMGVRLVLGMAGMAVGTVLRFFDWIKNE